MMIIFFIMRMFVTLSVLYTLIVLQACVRAYIRARKLLHQMEKEYKNLLN